MIPEHLLDPEATLLTWQELMGWLKSKPHEEVVGVPKEPTQDPVARFLKDKFGVTFAVYGEYAELMEPLPGEEERRFWYLPLWTLELTEEIDRRNEPITAAEAAHILDNVIWGSVPAGTAMRILTGELA